MRSTLLLVLMGLACTPVRPEGQPQPKTVTRPHAKEDVGIEERGTPTDPAFGLVSTICGSDCGGPMAKIRVYRDPEGRVGRLVYDGDLETCSHPPRVYFDAQGQQTLAIANEPIEAGSDRAKELEAQRAAQIEGLTEAELLGCPHTAACDPARTEGFRSDFECRTDGDCLDCECAPVSRDEWKRRGGADACQIPGEECMATNSACCDGKCVLSR